MIDPPSAPFPPDRPDTGALTELALNLRWAWNHSADELWGRLDPDLWRLTQNPWVILQTVSRDRLAAVSADPAFRARVEELLEEKRAAEDLPGWFQAVHPDPPLTTVAYFSMEFMLNEALPIYAGGLGNVAGDQLKSASDLGVPVRGVGLLYDQGYFRQEIDPAGLQHAFNPFNDPGQLPVRPLRDASGEWLRLALPFPGSAVWIRAWEVLVGRTRLYLLDTNDPANLPAHRSITSELYGGDAELRLKQEIVLGVGGWRLLRALGVRPEVCHLNEGHAAFAVLERARHYMADAHVPFDVALSVTRAGNLFTTHTPVEAGFDRFAPDLMARYLRHYAEGDLAIPLEALLALGRRDGRDPAEPFNMAFLAVRGSGAANGVSRLHGEVSRRIFQPLFPRWPQQEVPIAHVTNGVHVPTWDSADADRLWEGAGGKDRWRGEMTGLEKRFRTVSDADLWQLRARSRRQLVEYVRDRLALQWASQGVATAGIERVLDPETLTLGFARRFTAYKRPNLLLHDPDRLARILTSVQRPVQLVLAGKAHPRDAEGQAMIREWIDFLHRPGIRPHVVFLTDYDMHMAERFVQGIDVWINTPRRPWEACGTSGMKVLVNGGLNLSELDGWWAEAYAPDVGWAIGDRGEHPGDPAWDAAEADALYTCLEQDVVREFYTRDDQGIAPGWVARMRESMSRLTPAFSANRTVREYTERYYLPGAVAYAARAADGGRLGAELVAWRQTLTRCWPHVRLGDHTVTRDADQMVFRIQAYLDDLDAGMVQLELYAEGLSGAPAERHVMTRGAPLAGAANAFVYEARVPAARPPGDYTPRLVPHKPGAAVPLEASPILWSESGGGPAS
jgi:glycogen phosphorylase